MNEGVDLTRDIPGAPGAEPRAQAGSIASAAALPASKSSMPARRRGGQNRRRTAPDLRVPNALVRELANPEPDSFWRLVGHRQAVVALGLLGLVDPKHPDKEVVAKVTEVIDIVETARHIEHMVITEWTRLDGVTQSREYAAMVPRPKLYPEVNEALVWLFSTPFHITAIGYEKPRRGEGKPIKKETRVFVHFLDSFGYTYFDDEGQAMNLDLEPATTKVNVSQRQDRPVFKLRDGRRPGQIRFRINRELAEELRGRGRRYTVLLGGIFALLKQLAGDGAAVRVALWLVSQRERTVRRNRPWLLHRLVAGSGNRTQAESEQRLDAVLWKLRDLGVIEAIGEQPYAARSRKGGTFMVLTKGETWHVACRQERPR